MSSMRITVKNTPSGKRMEVINIPPLPPVRIKYFNIKDDPDNMIMVGQYVEIVPKGTVYSNNSVSDKCVVYSDDEFDCDEPVSGVEIDDEYGREMYDEDALEDDGFSDNEFDNEYAEWIDNM